MGLSYSLDLRTCVVAFVEAGHSRRAVALDLVSAKVSRSSFCDRWQHRDRASPISKANRPGAASWRLMGRFGVVDARARLYNAGARDRLMEACGVTADLAELSRLLCRQVTHIKSPDGHRARTRQRTRGTLDLENAPSADA